jgi:hypothetical protein
LGTFSSHFFKHFWSVGFTSLSSPPPPSELPACLPPPAPSTDLPLPFLVGVLPPLPPSAEAWGRFYETVSAEIYGEKFENWFPWLFCAVKPKNFVKNYLKHICLLFWEENWFEIGNQR